MRTTLTVDSDIVEKLKEIARLRRKSFKSVVNETLRAGLEHQRRRSEKERSFSVEPSNCGFLPGVDIEKLTQYADQLEADDFVAESRSDSHRHSHQ